MARPWTNQPSFAKIMRATKVMDVVMAQKVEVVTWQKTARVKTTHEHQELV